MTRQLLILRHAKSVRNSSSPYDFKRPLAKRGIKDALRIGYWMKTHNLYPEYIISSPAQRAKQTIYIVTRELNIPENRIHWDERIYIADIPILLKIVSECPILMGTILLVGHNPGLKNLLAFLCSEKLVRPAEENRFPTAALAHIQLSDDWSCLEARVGRLISLIQPRDIENHR